MSNSRNDSGAIDFLDENEQPTPELLAMHRRLEADGASWRRTLPSADPLLQWVSHGGLSVQSMAAADEEDVETSDHTPAAPYGTWQPPVTSRMQGMAAAGVALVVVLLFGLLMHFITGGNPATSVSTPTAISTAVASATAAVSGKWNHLSGLTLTSAPSNLSGQSGLVAIAPSDPQVIYEATQSPASLRRTHDSGVTWQQLALPVSASSVVAIQLYVSPLDAKILFMTLSTFTSVGATSHCLTGPTALTQHGGILADGAAWCDTTYLSVNSGSSLEYFGASCARSHHGRRRVAAGCGAESNTGAGQIALCACDLL